MSSADPPYEPTNDDRLSADEQATRIARELAALSGMPQSHERIATAKIEAAILAEVVMRGRPIHRRR